MVPGETPGNNREVTMARKKFSISCDSEQKDRIDEYVRNKPRWRKTGDFALFAMEEYMTRNPVRKGCGVQHDGTQQEYATLLKALYSLTERIKVLEGEK